MMRGALICGVAALLVACERRFPRLQSPTIEVQRPKTPVAPRLANQDGASASLSFTLQLSGDPCASDGDCVYQVSTGAQPAWTDAAFDRSAALPSFGVTLLGNQPNRLAVRTRDALQQVSDSVFVTIVHDGESPLPPEAVTVVADDGLLRVSWTPSPSADVVGYRVYYGGTSALDGVVSGQGASPITVDGLARSLPLSGMPNGTPVFVAISAVDGVFDAATVDGKTHESALRPASAAVAPTSFTLQAPLTFASAANILPRTLAVQGELVVLVSVDISNEVSLGQTSTVVQTFDLGALRKGEPLQPLDTLTLLESSYGFCKFPNAGGSLHDAPKHIELFDRFAFISSGTGNLFVVDVGNPSDVKFGMDATLDSGVFSASRTSSCAFDFSLIWPFAFIANGYAEDVPGTPFVDNTAGQISLRRFTYLGGQVSAPYPEMFTATGCNETIYGDAAHSLRAFSNKGTSTSTGLFAKQMAIGTPDGIYVGDMSVWLVPAVGPPSCKVGMGHGGTAIDTAPADQLVIEGPWLFRLGGLSSIGADSLGVFEHNLEFPTNTFDKVTEVDLPATGLSLAVSGSWIAVGLVNHEGVVLFDGRDLVGARPVVTLPTVGAATSIAWAGTRLVVADDGVGLTVWELAEPDVLERSQGTVATEMRPAFAADRVFTGTRVAAGDNLGQVSLRNADEARTVSGAPDEYCVNVSYANQRMSCTRTTVATPSDVRACVTHALGDENSWPGLCFDPITTVRSSVFAGIEALIAYDRAGTPTFRDDAIVDVNSSDASAPLNILTFSEVDDTSSTGRTTLPAVATLAPIRAAPGWAAVEVATGTALIDRANPSVPVVRHTFTGLFGAALGVTEVCGVSFSDATYLDCYALKTPFARSQHVAIAPAGCSTASVELQGGEAWVSIGGAAACEGLARVRWPGPTLSFLPIAGAGAAVHAAGREVYSSCNSGVCRAVVRR